MQTQTHIQTQHAKLIHALVESRHIGEYFTRLQCIS